jgi:hypothetical protein
LGRKFYPQELLTAPLQFSTLGITKKCFVNKVGEAQDFVLNKKKERKKNERKREIS